MNIYVGNLPYSTTEDDLRAMFERHGEVSSAKVVIDRETNRSKGFGFVEMPDDHDAEDAIKAAVEDYKARHAGDVKAAA